MVTYLLCVEMLLLCAHRNPPTCEIGMDDVRFHHVFENKNKENGISHLHFQDQNFGFNNSKH